jgi:peptide/nickel transport system substrate-binding protein
VILKALSTFNAGIMPEKLLMAAPGATVEDKTKAFADHPVGSGPFTLESWKRNSEMVLARNPYYWRDASDGKKLPYLDRVRLVIIPDDATRLLKLRAAELDVAEFVPYSRVAELRADPKLDMVLFPAAQVNYFSLNVRPTFKDGSKNPMADQRVRQALNYATDKDALIQAVSYGTGTPQRSMMPMSTPLADGPAQLYPYDPARAKALLAEAGYPQGFEITALALAGSADDAAKLTVLQQLWAQIGVRLRIEQLDAASRLARYNAGDFQMRASLWTNDINDPNEITRARRNWTPPGAPPSTRRCSGSTPKPRRSCSASTSRIPWRCARPCAASCRSRWATTCSWKPRSRSRHRLPCTC